MKEADQVHLAADDGSQGPVQAPSFARGSWQHAVDDALAEFGRTSEEFDSPHEAVAWLLGVQGEYAIAASGLVEIQRGTV